MSRRSPQRKGGTTLTNDERDFLLKGHDWFDAGFAARPEEMHALWLAHRNELLAMWHAPRILPSDPNWENDPLFWTEHGPDIKTYGERHFDNQPVRYSPPRETR